MEAQNKALIEHLRRKGVIKSKKVVEVLQTVDRGLFVPEEVERDDDGDGAHGGGEAYVDSPMYIGYNATISAPHKHGICLELLEERLGPGMCALDVRSEDLMDTLPHDEAEDERPDYFGSYIREIQEVFSPKDELLPPAMDHTGSGPLFRDGVGQGLSSLKKDRLKASLEQSVTTFRREVDEMIDPVSAMYRMQTRLKDRDCVACKPNALHESFGEHPCKKQKTSSSTCSPSSQTYEQTSQSGENNIKYADAITPEKRQFNNAQKKCSNCKTMNTPQWRQGADGIKSLCNACGLRWKKEKSSPLGFSKIEREKESENSGLEDSNKNAVDEDFEIILQSPQAEEIVNKHSSELYAKLNDMEKQVEEYIDLVASNSRNMTLAEKQELKKLIQSLPQKNLERVVELVQRKKPLRSDSQPCQEIHVDLEEEDNGTLWRLYYYVQAYKNAHPSGGGGKI